MGKSSTSSVYVGLDVHKDCIDIALAEAEGLGRCLENEMDMQNIIVEVQAEWQMSDADRRDGLISTFAAEVARRAIEAEREACAKACEDAETFIYDDPGASFAAAIRARSTGRFQA